MMLRGFLTVLCLGSANAAGADTIADFTDVPPPDIVSIQVASTPSVLRVGESSQLKVTGTFVDGEERDVTSNRHTFYTPDPETIAVVSDEGLIEALAVGSVALMVSHVQASGAVAFHQLELEVRPPGDAVESTDPPVPHRSLMGISPGLDDSCLVSALGRTVPVDADGTWGLPDVPADDGQLRVRAICVEGGISRFGQSDLVEVPPDGVIEGAEIDFSNPRAIPVTLSLNAPLTVLTDAGQTMQITVMATFADGSQADLTVAAGTDYTVSNPKVATVDTDGLLTAHASGTVLANATNGGATGLLSMQVALLGDTDGDGLPDVFELANGLDPNDAADALADPDGDGLSHLDEYLAAPGPRHP